MMSERARRWAFWALLVAIPTTALVSLVLVVSASSAAGVSAPPGAGWPGEIRLAGDDSSGLDLDVPAMLPGDVVEQCLSVSAVGGRSGVSELRVYGVASGPLADHLNISIWRGAVGGTCTAPGPMIEVFDGPLLDLGFDYATGSSGHRANASGSVVPYRVEVSLDDHAPNSAQGAAAELDLLWEVRGGARPR